MGAAKRSSRVRETPVDAGERALVLARTNARHFLHFWRSSRCVRCAYVRSSGHPSECFCALDRPPFLYTCAAYKNTPLFVPAECVFVGAHSALLSLCGSERLNFSTANTNIDSTRARERERENRHIQFCCISSREPIK